MPSGDVPSCEPTRRRSRLKRDLKAGRADLAGLIEETPEWLHSAKLVDILIALPRWGSVAVNAALVNCRISPAKTIGGLSDRQRAALITTLATSRKVSA